MLSQKDSSEDETSGGGEQESQYDSDSGQDRGGKMIARNSKVKGKNNDKIVTKKP